MSLHTSLLSKKVLPLLGIFAAILAATASIRPDLFKAQVENLVVNGPVLILAFTIGGYISNKFFLHDVEERMIRAFKKILADKNFMKHLKKELNGYFDEVLASGKKEMESYLVKIAKMIKKEVLGEDDESLPSDLTET